jgi:hypothetical protein
MTPQALAAVGDSAVALAGCCFELTATPTCCPLQTSSHPVRNIRCGHLVWLAVVCVMLQVGSEPVVGNTDFVDTEPLDQALSQKLTLQQRSDSQQNTAGLVLGKGPLGSMGVGCSSVAC